MSAAIGLLATPYSQSPQLGPRYGVTLDRDVQCYTQGKLIEDVFFDCGNADRDITNLDKWSS